MEAKLDVHKTNRETDQDTRKARENLTKAGEILMPYNAHYLGSMAFHFFAKQNLLLGRSEVGYVTQSTDINMSHHALNHILPLLKDEILKVIGAQKFVSRKETIEEKEERIENTAKMSEGGIILS